MISFFNIVILKKGDVVYTEPKETKGLSSGAMKS